MEFYIIKHSSLVGSNKCAFLGICGFDYDILTKEKYPAYDEWDLEVIIGSSESGRI